MPRKPQSYNNTTPVQQFTETAYDAVVICADNIDDIIRSASGAEVMALYLGAHATEPTDNNEGEPLVSGNFYLDTTTSSLKYWDSTNMVWVESDVDTVVTAAQAAIDARDAAQAAQAAAETAESNASTSAGQSASSASQAATSETNSANSATSSANSASAASADASAASASATAASNSAAASEASNVSSGTHASNAAASESNAAASAITASNAASQAEAAFDNFDDMYLGRKTVPPTTDNDGNPLQVGASYWHDNGDNTGEQRFWNGASWESPELTATQAAQVAVAARDDAQISETNAELYKDAAQASANAAGVDANNAGNSATAAANSAGTASTKAQEASDSADAANVSAGAASTSEGNAAASATASANSATAAANSATEAANTVAEFDWQKFVRGEAELNQMREQNKAPRAASGFDQYGKHFNNGISTVSVNEGMNTSVSVGTTNLLEMGRNDTTSDLQGTSETKFPVTVIAGFVSQLQYVNTTGANTFIKFPEAPDGTVTFDSSTGTIATHVDAAAAFLAETATNKVVIDRHDMFGGEFFLEEVSLTNPFVYPKGMIQSQFTSMNGISTTNSSRPVTYYAVYEGDVSSVGKGVDFFAATTQQKIDMVSDETNNIFMLADGRIVQWRMRQRTVAGAGNGDWYGINPSNNQYARFDTSDRLQPKGILDSQQSLGRHTDVNGGTYLGSDDRYNGGVVKNTLGNNVGVFLAAEWVSQHEITDLYAVNGECYFHVWGVVPRLNFGFYHPSFNPLGCAADINGKKWYDTTLTFNSTADCFDRTKVSHD